MNKLVLVSLALPALVLSTAARAETHSSLNAPERADWSPEALAKLITANNVEGNDVISLSTQGAVLIDPNAPPPKKPGLLSRALLGTLSVIVPKSANGEPPRPSNAEYMTVAIDRATGAATYRIHISRTSGSLQNLIPEFKLTYSATSETTQDTKGWRGSGSCTQGYWIRNSTFNTQSYIPPRCNYPQTYAFAVSQELLEKVAAGYATNKTSNLVGGFMGYMRKSSEASYIPLASFYPSEIKALLARVAEERVKPGTKIAPVVPSTAAAPAAPSPSTGGK